MNVKKKRKLISSHLKTKQWDFFHVLKTYQNANRKKNYPQKTFLNANYVFWDVAQIAKIDSEINLKTQSFLEQKKRERRWFRIQKTNIIGRLRALVCRLVYAWVGLTGAEGNGSVLFHWHVTPVTVVTRMKFVTQRFLYQTRCEIMFLIFGFFSLLYSFWRGGGTLLQH